MLYDYAESSAALPWKAFHFATDGDPQKPHQLKRKPVPDEEKTETYWKRRQRNNLSARKCRENKKTKEMQKELLIMHLERENLQLKKEIELLKEQFEPSRFIKVEFDRARADCECHKVFSTNLSYSNTEQTEALELVCPKGAYNLVYLPRRMGKTSSVRRHV